MGSGTGLGDRRDTDCLCSGAALKFKFEFKFKLTAFKSPGCPGDVPGEGCAKCADVGREGRLLGGPRRRAWCGGSLAGDGDAAIGALRPPPCTPGTEASADVALPLSWAWLLCGLLRSLGLVGLWRRGWMVSCGEEGWPCRAAMRLDLSCSI